MSQPCIVETPRVSIWFHGCKHATFFLPVEFDSSDSGAISFATLPSLGYIATAAPRIGEKKYQYAQYSTWQKDWRTTSPLLFPSVHVPPKSAQKGSELESTKPEWGGHFALKLAANVDCSDSGRALMARFYKEALFYKRYLSSVEGEAVPKHYGLWYGRTEWGAVVVISIMQWGGLSYIRRISGSRHDTREAK